MAILHFITRLFFFSSKKLANFMNTTMGGGNLEEEDYYHGLLPREDIPHLLINEGDFLVRSSETIPNQPRHVIISILVEKRGAIVSILQSLEIIRNILLEVNYKFKR